jgi:hypothetical protein
MVLSCHLKLTMTICHYAQGIIEDQVKLIVCKSWNCVDSIIVVVTIFIIGLSL